MPMRIERWLFALYFVWLSNRWTPRGIPTAPGIGAIVVETRPGAHVGLGLEEYRLIMTTERVIAPR